METRKIVVGSTTESPETVEVEVRDRDISDAAMDASYARLADRPVYVVDPLNPTDEELSAAIERGLANGTLIDSADWLAKNA